MIPRWRFWILRSMHVENDCGPAWRAIGTDEMYGTTVCINNSNQTNKSGLEPVSTAHMMQLRSPSRHLVASTPHIIDDRLRLDLRKNPINPTSRIILETATAGSTFCIHSSADGIQSVMIGKCTPSPRAASTGRIHRRR